MEKNISPAWIGRIFMESISRQVYKKSHGSYRDNDLQSKENVFDGFFGLQSVLALLKVVGQK